MNHEPEYHVDPASTADLAGTNHSAGPQQQASAPARPLPAEPGQGRRRAAGPGVTEAATSQVPVRGLAMVLLFVALLFLAWGAYSTLRPAALEAENAGATASSAAASGSSLAPSPESTGQQAAQPNATSGAPGAVGENAAGQNAVGQSAASQNAGNPNAANPAAAPVAGSPIAPVVVYNNSLVQGLAGRVGDELRGDFNVTEVGNYAATQLPASVAYFQPQEPNAAATAQAIAQRLGIKAEPRPADFQGPASGVILILTGDVQR